ncbi:MAG: alpha-2-macroglobulin family protein, partial [Myxococcota bacterium]
MRSIVAALAVYGCGSVSSEMAPVTTRGFDADLKEEAPPPAASPAARQEAVADGTVAFAKSVGALGGAMAGEDLPAEPEAVEQSKPDDGEPADEGRTRSWFPEAFLWQPQVETGDDGGATIDVTVPDALTTWRVLALAHDLQGQQAGTVTTFDGTLPLYVDPVVPGWLYAGDRLVLPVQAVNTTAAPVSAALDLTAEGALSGTGHAAIALSAAGSDVRSIALDAVGAGSAKITAHLAAGADSDTAERTIPVAPSGRPVVAAR